MTRETRLKPNKDGFRLVLDEVSGARMSPRTARRDRDHGIARLPRPACVAYRRSLGPSASAYGPLFARASVELHVRPPEVNLSSTVIRRAQPVLNPSQLFHAFRWQVRLRVNGTPVRRPRSRILVLKHTVRPINHGGRLVASSRNRGSGNSLVAP